MKRPVLIDARYHDAAKRLSRSIGMKPGDVLCMSLEHHVTMIETISRAGLG